MIDHFRIEIKIWPNNMKHKPLVTLRMIPISLFGLDWFWQHWSLCYNVLEQIITTFDAFTIDLLIYQTYIVVHISPFIILCDEMAYVFPVCKSKIWQHLQTISLAIFYDHICIGCDVSEGRLLCIFLFCFVVMYFYTCKLEEEEENKFHPIHLYWCHETFKYT
jgi:hypothetical protein